MGIQNHLTLEKSINKFTYVNILSKEKKTYHVIKQQQNRCKKIHHPFRGNINRRELTWLYKGNIKKKKKVQQTYIVVKF